MKTLRKFKVPEWVTAGLAFIYYWIMALYKLTNAPIWQDESMEYYCSIPVKGAIQGVTQYTTMYERMAYIQQQPPLYNWLMRIWLQIHDSEWWYRFSSVVMGFIAVIGLYLVIKKLCGRFSATLSVFVFSSIYILMYYVKEASEYMLLIMLLIWTVYLYLFILEQITIKRAIMFTVLCVVDVYTHYGAVFVIIPMALQLLVYYWKSGEKKTFWSAMISYVVAGMGAGIPLLYFFMLPQSTNPISTLGADKPIEITGNNVILDFFDSLMWVLRWCMLDYDRDAEKITWAIWIILFALLGLGIFVYRKTHRKEVKFFIRCNIWVFLIYYVITTLNIYAYGWFGNRYNLFIFPLWFILIAVILYETVMIFKESGKQWMRKVSPFISVGVVIAMVLYCTYGDYRISNHWAKSDLRTVVRTWRSDDGEEVPTFVNFHQRYAFVYYLTHSEGYQESDWNQIYCNETLETLNYSDGEWISFLNENVYPDGLPKQIYVVSGQHDTVVNALESIGYQTTAVVDTTAKLFLLEQK